MKSPRRQKNQMQGLSLVELMVALTIGLIILTAVSSLFVSSKQTYTTQDSLARLQENARFAMQFLMKDLRLAGYFGCLNTIDISTAAISGAPTFYNNAFFSLEGVENASGTWSRSGTTFPTGMKAGTDAIVIRFADESVSSPIAPGMLNGFGTVIVNNASDFDPSDNIVVSDCEGADVVQVTGISGNSLLRNPGELKKAYAPPARVYRMMTREYFIGTKSVDGKTIPVLMREDNNGGPNELVEGVENMQVLYGEDTDSPPDGLPNIYRKANAVTAANWARIVSVRIGILVRTIDDKNTDLDNGNYDVDGDGTAELSGPGDRYRRKIFQTTVQLRNLRDLPL